MGYQLTARIIQIHTHAPYLLLPVGHFIDFFMLSSYSHMRPSGSRVRLSQTHPATHYKMSYLSKLTRFGAVARPIARVIGRPQFRNFSNHVDATKGVVFEGIMHFFTS